MSNMGYYRETNVYYYIKIGKNYLFELKSKGIVTITTTMSNAWVLNSSDLEDDLEKIEKEINRITSMLKVFNVESEVLKVVKHTDVSYEPSVVSFNEDEEE